MKYIILKNLLIVSIQHINTRMVVIHYILERVLYTHPS